MRILIGTPIHESKDYSMERWISSVSKIDYPFDLLMVDNSENKNYQKKVHEYCKKYGLKNYKIIKLDTSSLLSPEERLSVSREVIRKEILGKKYDAWLSLECDVIAPPDSAAKLIDMAEGYQMVKHSYPARSVTGRINSELGLSLIKKSALKKYSFSDNPKSSSGGGGDVRFITNLSHDKNGKLLTVSGIISPIYHLAN